MSFVSQTELSLCKRYVSLLWWIVCSLSGDLSSSLCSSQLENCLISRSIFCQHLQAKLSSSYTESYTDTSSHTQWLLYSRCSPTSTASTSLRGLHYDLLYSRPNSVLRKEKSVIIKSSQKKTFVLPLVMRSLIHDSDFCLNQFTKNISSVTLISYCIFTPVCGDKCSIFYVINEALNWLVKNNKSYFFIKSFPIYKPTIKRIQSSKMYFINGF